MIQVLLEYFSHFNIRIFTTKHRIELLQVKFNEI